MLFVKSLKKLTLTALLIGSASIVAKVVSAQSPFYYYPSASFFTPQAYSFQSDEALGLTDVLAADDQFATFASSLATAELADILQQEDALTVLAPTEAAFDALSPEQKEQLADPETLEKVLRYHLIIGNIDEDDIKRRGVLTMLERNPIEISGEEGEGEEVTVKLNDATASDPLGADNGLVIPIDKVLIPPSL